MHLCVHVHVCACDRVQVHCMMHSLLLVLRFQNSMHQPACWYIKQQKCAATPTSRIKLIVFTIMLCCFRIIVQLETIQALLHLRHYVMLIIYQWNLHAVLGPVLPIQGRIEGGALGAHGGLGAGMPCHQAWGMTRTQSTLQLQLEHIYN